MKSCVMCGCVASPEPEFSDYCPSCISLTWGVAEALFSNTSERDNWENVCFPPAPEPLEQQRDRVLKKLISGLPELMGKLDTAPGSEVKLSWVNPRDNKNRPKPT